MPLLSPAGVVNIDNEVEVLVILTLDGSANATVSLPAGITNVLAPASAPAVAHPGTGRYTFTLLPDVMRTQLHVETCTIVGAISGGRGYIPQLTTDLNASTGVFEITFQTGAGVAADPPINTTLRLTFRGRK